MPVHRVSNVGRCRRRSARRRDRSASATARGDHRHRRAARVESAGHADLGHALRRRSARAARHRRHVRARDDRAEPRHQGRARRRQYRRRPSRFAASAAAAAPPASAASASTSTTSSCRARRVPSCACSTSSASKCCAARRARCSAATARAAPSACSRASRSNERDAYLRVTLGNFDHQDVARHDQRAAQRRGRSARAAREPERRRLSPSRPATARRQRGHDRAAAGRLASQ